MSGSVDSTGFGKQRLGVVTSQEKLNFCLPQILKILKKSEAANFEVNWIKNS